MPGSYSCLLCHVVFSTKDRHPVLTPEVTGRLWDYMGGILTRHKCNPIEIGGTADHVHVLMGLERDQCVANAVRDLKANSSRWLRAEFEFLSTFAWQSGYGAFSVGIAGIERNRQYIRNQEAHHRTRGFQEEFIAFLQRHGVDYDVRYVWE
ncbi:MAG: IS200/IS605 family transposase [Armatimonadetes bacterium]|nr:IS200/IS605 family transposase [Armatimonadota bacterium]